MNSLSEGKTVQDKRKTSTRVGDGSFEGEGVEVEFFPEIQWRIAGSC